MLDERSWGQKMWDKVGVLRSDKGNLLHELKKIGSSFEDPSVEETRRKRRGIRNAILLVTALGISQAVRSKSEDRQAEEQPMPVPATGTDYSLSPVTQELPATTSGEWYVEAISQRNRRNYSAAREALQKAEAAYKSETNTDTVSGEIKEEWEVLRSLVDSQKSFSE